MLPLAAELNASLEKEAPAVLEMLSDLGRRLYFPKGIISQSAEAKAKAHRFNATIGIATEKGGPMHLASLQRYFQLEPKDLYPYAPTGGRQDLRDAWREKQLRENPRMRGKALGLPIVTAALTHGLGLASELFVNPGDRVLLADKLWGNYRLTFEVRQGGVIETFPLFDGPRFHRAAFAAKLEELAAREKKAIVLLNFPNNPTGFTPSRADADAIAQAVLAAAEKGLRQVVLCDDAYFGLFYDEECLPESIFGYLAGLHPNVLAVKLDGATKEEFAWGFRVGFITFGAAGKGSLDAVHAALEKKTIGAIRGGISSSPHPSQTVVLKALRSPTFEAERAEKKEVLRARAARVHEVLGKKEYEEAWTPYPFNSGYFMCVRLKGVDAEKLRVHLLERYQTGVIATDPADIRIAFSCLEVEQIEEVFDTMYRAWRELAGR
ncbi:MAG: aminotransferase class I/II-fold pyridoxal phosphate-dependent enzyme [Planctomycetes bacterium]|nr:aminotransferase class I/II-fold pyridoxal phosphate-dependent enzyme [Planctomycetota bacterium]